jgi:hypothetical protein
METGLSRRKIGETLINAQSSRSHTIFTIHLQKHQKGPEFECLQSSKICVVDLAGSETVAKAGLSPVRVKESSFINKSLSALCDIIQTLSKRSTTLKMSPNISRQPSDFVSYRNSMLTWLLKDMISGNNCMTTILATVGPTAITVKESERTLRYVQRAKFITNNVSLNEKSKIKETERISDLLTAMKSITERFDKLVTEQKQKDQQYLAYFDDMKSTIKTEINGDLLSIVKKIRVLKNEKFSTADDNFLQVTSFIETLFI